MSYLDAFLHDLFVTNITNVFLLPATLNEHVFSCYEGVGMALRCQFWHEPIGDKYHNGS